jgi:hypothetical protein
MDECVDVSLNVGWVNEWIGGWWMDGNIYGRMNE